MSQQEPYPTISYPQASGHIKYIPDMAIEIAEMEGITASQAEKVMLAVNQVAYLCNAARLDNRTRNFQKGHWWTYQSLRDWHKKYFKSWSHETVRRIFDLAVKHKYIILGNFNKLQWDKTGWYRPNFDKLATMKSIQVIDFSPPQPKESTDDLSQDVTGKRDDLSQDVTGESQDVTGESQDVTTIPKTPSKTPPQTPEEEEGDNSLSCSGLNDPIFVDLDLNGDEIPVVFDPDDPFVRNILDNLFGSPKNLEGGQRKYFTRDVLEKAKDDPDWAKWCLWQANYNSKNEKLRTFLKYIANLNDFEAWKAGLFVPSKEISIPGVSRGFATNKKPTEHLPAPMDTSYEWGEENNEEVEIEPFEL